MKKIISSIVGSALLLSTIAMAAPAKADYPPAPNPNAYPNVNGLDLIGGSAGSPIAIDFSPKSIPSNSNVSTFSLTKKSATVEPYKSTVFKFTSLPKSTYAEATIVSSDGTSAAYLGAVKTDKKGNLQLPAFALFTPGSYTLTVKVGKVTRKIKITVN
jgi:hypothetical protein